MPYRGAIPPRERTTADRAATVLTYVAVAALAYPVPRLAVDLTPRAALDPDALRVVTIALIVLAGAAPVVGIALVWCTRDNAGRALAAAGGLLAVVSAGLEIITLFASHPVTALGAAVLYNLGVAATAAAVVRAPRADRNAGGSLLLWSVIGLSAGAVAQTAMTAFGGFVSSSSFRPGPDAHVRRLLYALHVVFELAPLVLLSAGALVRARVRAPLSTERPDLPPDLVPRLHSAREVLNSLALATIAATLPGVVCVAAVIVRDGGPVGTQPLGTELIVLQGVLAVAVVKSHVASSAPLVRNDARPARMGVLLAAVFQCVVVIFGCGGRHLGLDLEGALPTGAWAAGAGASLLAQSALARGILAQTANLVTAAGTPAALAASLTERHRPARVAAVAGSVSTGALFVGETATRADIATVVWGISTIAAAVAITAVVRAAGGPRPSARRG